VLKERRYYPRYQVELALILDIAQQSYYASSTNLSLNGVELNADIAIVSAFEQINAHPAYCHISLPLPNGDFLKLRSRLIVKRRKTQATYILGFKFIELSHIEQLQLRSLIAQQR